MPESNQLDKLSDAANVGQRRSNNAKLASEVESVRAEVEQLRKELAIEQAKNKQFITGQTKEDVDKANAAIARIHNKGFKSGMTWYTYYDRRLQKGEHRAPRHRCCLNTKPEEGQEAIREEWIKRTKIQWTGEGAFPFIFEPVENKEEVAAT